MNLFKWFRKKEIPEAIDHEKDFGHETLIGLERQAFNTDDSDNSGDDSGDLRKGLIISEGDFLASGDFGAACQSEPKEEQQEEVKPEPPIRPNHTGQFIPEEPEELFKPEPQIPIFDEHSSQWQYTVKYIERRINTLHLENENTGLSEVKTAAMRGAIKELRLLLKVPARIRAGENLLDPPQS